MKKSTLLKSVLTVVSVFTISGVMAQASDPAAIKTDYTKNAETIYQTVGLGLTLYALPDLVYSPSYVAADNSGYNTSSQWKWETGGTAWGTGTTELKAWSNQNYVEIAAAKIPAANTSLVVRVKERFNVAGACESTTEQTKTINGVAAPAITAIAATNNSGDWTEVTAGVTYSYCGENLGDVIDVTITETGVLDAMKKYTYGVTVMKATGDMNGNWNTAAAEATMTANLAVDMTGGATITVPTLTMATDPNSAKLPTKYTFQITENSFYSYTSRVSCKRAGEANKTYTAPATVISYILYPTPTTGPIYHIINDFSF